MSDELHAPEPELDNDENVVDTRDCVVLTRAQWRLILASIVAVAVLAIVGSAVLTFTFRDEVRSDAGIVERAQRGHHLCRSVPSCRAEFRKLERAAR